LPMVP